MENSIKIKTSWDKVTLEEYIAISENHFDEEMEGLNLLKSVKLISILSNKTEKEILKFDQNMLSELIPKFAFVFNTDPKDKSKKVFTVNGCNYMFTPDFNNLNAGEMISIEVLLRDSVKKEKGFLTELLAILVRPAIEKTNKVNGKKEFEIEEFDTEYLSDRQELFKKHLYAPNFASRITAFIDGTKISETGFRLSSVRSDQMKARLKKLIH